MSVNGPINIVRLEGEINNVKKVLYVMMDFHVAVHDQTECEDMESEDITSYMAKEFKKLDRTIDLFLETYPAEIKRDPYKDRNYKYMYLIQFRKYFNKELKENKFEKVRLHYIDIRDYVFNFALREEIINIYSYIKKNNIYDIFTLDDLLERINKYISHYKIIYDALKKREYIQKKGDIISTDAPIENTKYLFWKITSKYNNKDIMDKLNRYVDIILKNYKKYIVQLNKIIKQIQNIKNKSNQTTDSLLYYYKNKGYGYDEQSGENIKNMLKICDEIGIILYNILDTDTLVMDVYFLRRFLDKDYITNGISYTGAAHSLNYVKILVTDFNFKITHTSYSKIENMEELERYVIRHNEDEISSILYPPKLYQCSDLSSFPENFK